jgi:hypothetical protein
MPLWVQLVWRVSARAEGGERTCVAVFGTGRGELKRQQNQQKQLVLQEWREARELEPLKESVHRCAPPRARAGRQARRGAVTAVTAGAAARRSVGSAYRVC